MAKTNQIAVTQLDQREGAWAFPKAQPEVVETAQPKGVQIIVTPAGAKKADLARAIFNECYKDHHIDPKTVPQRKDIIARFVNEAGLTPAGAATYLQNMKTKAGLVVSKK